MTLSIKNSFCATPSLPSAGDAFARYSVHRLLTAGRPGAPLFSGGGGGNTLLEGNKGLPQGGYCPEVFAL